MKDPVQRDKSLGNEGEWSNLYYTRLTLAPSGESGKGNCQRTNKGGFWVGFPTQVQEGEQTSVSLKAVRPGQSLVMG